MKIIEHKGYRAAVNYDGRKDVFHGRAVGNRDIIVFVATGEHIRESSSPDKSWEVRRRRSFTETEIEGALQKELEYAIDMYFETCADKEIEPDKSLTGNNDVTIPDETHQTTRGEASGAVVFHDPRLKRSAEQLQQIIENIFNPKNRSPIYWGDIKSVLIASGAVISVCDGYGIFHDSNEDSYIGCGPSHMVHPTHRALPGAAPAWALRGQARIGIEMSVELNGHILQEIRVNAEDEEKRSDGYSRDEIEDARLLLEKAGIKPLIETPKERS